MATVIDALMVTLGLDSSEFKRGFKEVQRSQKDLTEQTRKGTRKREEISRREANEKRKHFVQSQEQFKKSADSIRKIRTEALSTLAVFMGGMGMLEFAKSTIFTSAAIGRMSDNIGMSVKQIAGWQGALKSVGGTSADASGLLSAVAGSIGSLQAGSEPDTLMNAFQKYGGHLANGTKTTTAQYLTGISQLLHRLYAQSPREAEAVARQMGLSQSSFNLLKQGPTAVDRQVAHYGRLSGMNKRFSRENERLQGQFATIDMKLRELGIDVMTGLMPAIQQLVKLLQQFGAWVDTHGTQIQTWVSRAANDTVKFAKAANDVAQALGGWKTALLAIAGIKLAKTLGPLAGMGGGRGGLFAASGFAGYEVGKHIFDPGINWAGRMLTGDNSWTLGNGLFGGVNGHYNPNAPDGGQAALAKMRAQYHIVRGAHGWTRSTVNNNQREIHIGKIDVHTQAADAQGIAGSLGTELTRYGFTHQANSGTD